jgi:flagella basal body P-ring formation protein FlgA
MRPLPFLLLALAAALPAQAATLRPVATLAAPVVRLSDLFDGLDAEGLRVLGPGPAPGGRIVVESAQLAAIARQFGIDWRPNGPGERAVLERPGRMLPREEVLAALREALARLGAPEDFDLDLPGYAAPLVPAESPVRIEVEQLDHDGASGRFAASIAILGEGMLAQRQRLAGTLHEVADLPVPVRRLAPGAVLAASDLRVERVRVGALRGEVVRVPAEAIGMALRRPVPAGQPVPLADLHRAALVTKGARVLMQLSTGGMVLAAQGQALEDGAAGARIQVLNSASRAVVEAEVTGPGRVRVAPGSMPLAPSTPSRRPIAQVQRP